MIKAISSAISGLLGQQKKMDVVANNVANVDTPGFKSSKVTFEDVMSQTVSNDTPPSSTGAMGSTNPVQVGRGVAVAAINRTNIRGPVVRKKFIRAMMWMQNKQCDVVKISDDWCNLYRQLLYPDFLSRCPFLDIPA